MIEVTFFLNDTDCLLVYEICFNSLAPLYDRPVGIAKCLQEYFECVNFMGFFRK